ncbi:MAG: glycosyltransferase [Candidatus Aureabacteria bacterium]|nr:glycosyltransferase [Candidatus Auribacterota bacterium]
MKEHTISIIIPTKNAGRFLDEQLRAIFTQEGVPTPEIVIIDSGSTDGTKKIAARYPVKLVSIPPEQFNHGGTRNLGARESRGDFIVFLTQDATPADEFWLAHLTAPLRENPGVAGTFSRHIPRSGCAMPLARQIEEEWAQCGGKQRVVKIVSSREELESNKPHYVYFANTSSCIRRSVWEKLPFRDVEFGEDVDWAERILLAGHTIVYEPSSAVYHSHDYSLKEQVRQHYDYGRMVRSAALAKKISIARTLTAFFQSLRRDAAYMRKKKLPACEVAYSIPFHAACGLGRWLGEHSSRLPNGLRRYLSRQRTLQDR